MAQHDGVIADQAGLAFLSDLNNALAALWSQNSGPTEPTTTYPGMPWLDTSGATPVLKQRNQANSGWNTLSSLLDAEMLPSPTASGYVKRNAANDGYETKTAQEVANEVGPLAPGAVLQRSITHVGALVSAASIVPYDDTIPQITEGAEALSVSFTPKRADSRIRIRAVLQVSTGTAARIIIGALFRAGVSDALSAAAYYSDDAATPGMSILTIIADIASPGTSAQTFSARFGPAAAGSVYLNGNAVGARIFGGVSGSVLEIEEYL